jgi:acyl carrier protein
MKIENYYDEDIFDVIVKLEKSFQIKLSKTAFICAKTFGDIYDIL